MSARDDMDIRITPAQRAYLAAFDYWLKHTWATGRPGRMHDGATAMKDACFDAMVGGGEAALDIRPQGAICRDCGRPFVPLTNRGRPRARCYVCSPAQFKAGA